MTGCENAEIGGYYFDTITQDEFDFNPKVYFSCHSCTDPNKIPFLFQDSDEDNSTEVAFLNNFVLDNTTDPPNNTALETGLMIQCLEPVASSFSIPPVDFTKVFPDNCGLGMF